MLIRLEALELCANAGAPTDSDRFNLHLLQVQPDGSVVTTDGFQILRIKAAVEEPGLFDALLPAAERGYEGEVLIDATDARDFKAACAKALKRAGRKSVAEGGEPVHVVVAQDDEQLTMATADGVVERRFIIKQPTTEQKFPDIDRVLGAVDTDRKITVSVDLMIRLLRTLKKLKVHAVTLGLPPESNRAIRITAKSLAGDIKGALMPMRDAEDEEPKAEHVNTETGEVTEVSVRQAVRNLQKTLTKDGATATITRPDGTGVHLDGNTVTPIGGRA